VAAVAHTLLPHQPAVQAETVAVAVAAGSIILSTEQFMEFISRLPEILLVPEQITQVAAAEAQDTIVVIRMAPAAEAVRAWLS
jgi:hypothetical protein